MFYDVLAGVTWQVGWTYRDQGNAPKPLPTMEELAKKKREQELDKFTMYLGRPDTETKPWYTDRELKRAEEKESGEEADIRRERERSVNPPPWGEIILVLRGSVDRRKDARAKDRYDPLTHVNSLLASHPLPHHSKPNRSSGQPFDARGARRQREVSERERALALVAQSKAPARGGWNETPSSVGGGRSWAEDFERQKDRAGHRFFGDGAGREEGRVVRSAGWDRRGKIGGRSWEV